MDEIDDSEAMSLEEGSDVTSENLKYSGLVSYIKEKFERSKSNRQSDEERWLEAYRNYRGQYGPEVQFTETEKSQAFVKITKTKVLAAYAQIVDVLFSTGKFPIGIQPTKVPEGIAEAVHFDPKSPENDKKEKSSNPTTARKNILEEIGALKKTLEPVADKLKEGEGKTPTAYTFHPAEHAAKKMEKLMLDQFEEANASNHLRRFAFELALFGHGFIKGPTAKSKEYPRWTENGYNPVIKTIADISHVSIWDCYPDPDARSMEESEFFIQRHRLNRSQLRGLKKRPGFRTESIEKTIGNGPNYLREYWEDTLEESNTSGYSIDRWEVFEFWGIIDSELAEEADIEIPKELKSHDQLQINAWVCGGEILRIVLNPFKPARIPYHSCPYELNPYSFFGIGVAENMSDTQLLMNGFIRLAVDNAALSSNLIIEIDETNLVPGQSMDLYPGKVFRRQGGAPGQAIFGTKLPNLTQECLMMFDKARQLADESTGMPSYAHGQTGIQNTGRTAAGMSMLMGAADKNIKAVIKNIDDYILNPLGKASFAFNMQFNYDKDIVGDLEVIALGTESLMRNEVRSQKLLQFMQLTANPMYTPFVKMDYILRELSASLDLDPDKIVNDPREAGIQAEIIKETQMKMGIDPNKQQGGPPAGNPAGAPATSDPTGNGGGNIAPGQAQAPGEQGFTGAGGGSNIQQVN
jgi:hypothetical protein